MRAQPLLTAAGLRRIEAQYRDQPLMQRAGEAAARLACQIAADQDGPILIVAGPGNNGGDAFVAATLLRHWGHTTELVCCGDPERLPADAAAAYAGYLAAGGTPSTGIPPHRPWRLIIDGLFGIGLSRAPEGAAAKLIEQVNQLSAELACPLLALDCPSGLDADTGRAHSPCICASHTLSFIAGKPGLYTADGPDQCGKLSLAGLALDVSAHADGHTVAIEQFASALQPRRQNSHKGDHGNAGILGGAHSMPGAVFLAGRAALKLGAGRVYLGLLAADAPPLDVVQPELMLRRPEGLFGANLSALACGPGLGTSVQAAELLEHAFSQPIPLILDADAINVLAFESGLQTLLAARQMPTLLTPHPGEAGRLLDRSAEEVQQDRLGAALEMAARFRSHVVLKGCGSIIAAPDGRWWINTSGNPALATAGTGDVLTGMIVALLAQGWPMQEAALAAVHLHGAAADALVAGGVGPVGLTAGELIEPARTIFNTWMTTRHAV